MRDEKEEREGKKNDKEMKRTEVSTLLERDSRVNATRTRDGSQNGNWRITRSVELSIHFRARA